MKNYGDFLKEYRQLSGKSLNEIESATGISNQNLSRWERGLVVPSIYFCEQLADFYGISIDELVGRSDSAPAHTLDLSKPEEQELLEIYRALDPETRAALWSLLNTWKPVQSVMGDKKPLK